MAIISQCAHLPIPSILHTYDKSPGLNQVQYLVHSPYGCNLAIARHGNSTSRLILVGGVMSSRWLHGLCAIVMIQIGSRGTYCHQYPGRSASQQGLSTTYRPLQNMTCTNSNSRGGPIGDKNNEIPGEGPLLQNWAAQVCRACIFSAVERERTAGPPFFPLHRAPFTEPHSCTPRI